MKKLHLHESEAIFAAAYDAVAGILRIAFKAKDSSQGDTYDYFGVPPDVVQELVEAESHGQFVNWEIKPFYRYEEVMA